MANTTMPGIERSFTFVAFVRGFAHTIVNPAINKETGEEFNSLICEDANKQQTIVNFSTNLEEVKGLSKEDTMKYLSENKYDLQVVLKKDGKYTIAKKGHIDTSAGVELVL